MAVKIPIVSVFDDKGLKQAQYQLKKVEGNINNLKRNFALAGAAVAGFGLVIGKSVQALSRIETINAQTATVIKSMGNAANISAGQVTKLADDLEKLTATEAETIQEGANLLLTFRNITNGLGAGNDIFNQTTAIMVDMGRALNEGASASAIRLGKALNDPIRGITALRKVGVGFTTDQEAQIKVLQESGDIMGAQKIILAELQAQFGGSGAAFAQTFTGQLELLQHELGAVGEEATMAVMPALQGMVTELRALIPVIGPQLKEAIESVDWAGLVKALVDGITFFVENARVIGTVVAAMFLLNTAYNVGRVAIGLYNAAAVIGNAVIAATGTASATAAGKVTLLGTALKLIPWVALAGGIALVATEIVNSGPKFDTYKRKLEAVDTAVLKVNPNLSAFALTALDIQAKYLPVVGLLRNLAAAMLGIPKSVTTDITVNYVEVGRTAATTRPSIGGARAGGASGLVVPDVELPPGPGPAARTDPGGLKQFTADLKRQGTIARKEARLEGKGLSEALAQSIVGSKTPIKTANQVLARIQKNGAKAVTNLQRQFNRTAAGQSEIAAQMAEQQRQLDEANASAAQAAEEAARQAQQMAQEYSRQQEEAMRQAQEQAQEIARQAEEQARELQRIQEEARRAEEEILRERQRVYNSFLDSVQNTFGRIKDSILGAFDITQLGGSTNSIIRNMNKLLATTKNFSQNIQQLATMGLNPTLLAQVIQAGPLAGARLAASLVSGGAAAISQISAGFSEFEGVASGIATTGVNSRFGTAQQQTIYNINVNGGVGSGPTIGKSIVDAIKAYERSSGAVWVGA